MESISTMKDSLLKSTVNENNILKRPSIDITNLMYTNNAPRILLEVISPRTITIILMITYLATFIGCTIDFRITYDGYMNDEGPNILKATSCSSQNISYTHPPAGNWGCTSGNKWNGTLLNLENVISVQLNVLSGNMTLTNSSLSNEIDYKVKLWACYNRKGCGDNFVTNSPSNNQENYAWHQVLYYDSYITYNNNKFYSYEMFPNTFQNQESIPTRGIVQSYFFSVIYENDINHLFTDLEDSTEVKYVIEIFNRPWDFLANFMIAFLTSITIICTVAYGYIMSIQKSAWLSEQKWLLFYLIALIMYQNPIYCVLVWNNTPCDVNIVYASYLLGAIGQAFLFIVWLLFADSINRQKSTKIGFYFPKILFGLFILGSNLVVLTFQFPNLNPSEETSRNAVEAVLNWSDASKEIFVSFSICLLSLTMIWAVWWFIVLYNTGNILAKLPYMSTRYLQLSYRFFFLQASLVTIYYVLQNSYVLYLISQTNKNETTITDAINTLFRQQISVPGKVFFLTAYAFILCFIYLPTDLVDKNVFQNFSSTYVITEENLKIVRRSRKKSLVNFELNMQKNEKIKVDVFCVDIAIGMCNLSYEAYYDVEGKITDSGFPGKFIEVENLHYDIIDTMYDKEFDTFCLVCKHKTQKKIAVAFRGSSSQKHWNNNLKTTQVEVDFFNLNLDSLDAIDGLDLDENVISNKDITKLNLHDYVDTDSSDEDCNVEEISLDSSMSSLEDLDQPLKRTSSEVMRDSFSKVSKMGSRVKFVTKSALSQSSKIVSIAASKNKVLRKFLRSHIHGGFWDAYSTIRFFVHAVLRRELAQESCSIYFTGHSLGGAISTLAALDVKINTIPRIHAYYQRKLYEMNKVVHENTLLNSKSNIFNSSPTKIHFSKESNEEFNNIKIAMYNYGSPRVGNRAFRNLYEKAVPNSFRCVVDGDIVTGLPKHGFHHIGTSVVLDFGGTGSIIIDPSFVERRLRTHLKSSVSCHALLVYKRGLLGVKTSDEFMRAYNAEAKSRAVIKDDPIDAIQIALSYGAYLENMNSDVENAMLSVSNNDIQSDKTAGNIEEETIKTSMFDFIKKQTFDFSHSRRESKQLVKI